MTFIAFNTTHNKITLLSAKAEQELASPLTNYQDLYRKNLPKKAAWQKQAQEFIKNTQAFDHRTSQSVEAWRENFQKLSPAKRPKSQGLQNSEVLLKRAKRLKTAHKVLHLGGLSLLGVGILSGFIIQRLGHLFIPLPLAIPLTLGSFGVQAIGGLCLACAGIIHLASRKVFREKRTLKSPSFNEFVKKYAITTSFQPTQADLTDAKLHKIYTDWKKAAKANVDSGNKLLATGKKLF